MINGDTGMSKSEWKPTKPEDSDFKCQKCQSDDIWYSVWESSDGGHTDINYHCKGCNRRWWVEGSDY